MVSSPLETVFTGREHEMPAEFVAQFLASPEQDHNVVLEGTMHNIWFPAWLKPLFWLLGKFGVLVPRAGTNISATLEVIPGRLPNGEPFHEWNRTFYFDPPLQFNTTVVYDHKMRNIADVVGKNRTLHMVWKGQFHSPDTFTLDTVTNAVKLGSRLTYLPKWLWTIALGRAKFSQRARKEDDNTVDVDLRIIHPWFNEVFGYQGTFTAKRYPKAAHA
jgi:hypothetical protein